MRGAWLFVLAACGGRTDLGGERSDASSPPATELHGVVVNECAPNDGLQITFVLAVPGANVLPTCSDALNGAGRIRISFWQPIPMGPGTYSIGDGSFASGSSAWFCVLDGTACFTPDHGTLTLTLGTPTAYSGSFSVVLPDQTVVSGSFSNVPYCNNSIMCG